MKVLTWSVGDAPPRPGLLRGDAVVDLTPWFRDVRALIDAGGDGLTQAHAVLVTAPDAADLADVTLHAPLRPRQLRDFLVFEEHLRNGLTQHLRSRWGRLGAELLLRTGVARIPAVWYERPLYYKANRLSVVGHGAEVRWPSYARVLDYELELAVVIGRTGVDIPAERAHEHVFGYTIFNDVSARDVQAREMGPGFHLGPSKSKDFDTGNVLGPWIVTADELPDPGALTMQARVNGETWSRGSSSAMRWSFAELIAWVSRSETLYAGEVLGSGTVGTGCGLELGRWVQPGDVVELEIEGIGVLCNRFVGPRGD